MVRPYLQRHRIAVRVVENAVRSRRILALHVERANPGRELYRLGARLGGGHVELGVRKRIRAADDEARIRPHAVERSHGQRPAYATREHPGPLRHEREHHARRRVRDDARTSQPLEALSLRLAIRHALAVEHAVQGHDRMQHGGAVVRINYVLARAFKDSVCAHLYLVRDLQGAGRRRSGTKPRVFEIAARAYAWRDEVAFALLHERLCQRAAASHVGGVELRACRDVDDVLGRAGRPETSTERDLGAVRHRRHCIAPILLACIRDRKIDGIRYHEVVRIARIVRGAADVRIPLCGIVRRAGAPADPRERLVCGLCDERARGGHRKKQRLGLHFFFSFFSGPSRPSMPVMSP